jgi:tetratricopeptide (TPR) repeat protein
MRPKFLFPLRVAVIVVFGSLPLLADEQGGAQPNLRTLRGTVVTMMSESEGLPSKFWAKGNLYRSETTFGDRKLISIQRGSDLYIFEQGSTTGEIIALGRGLGTIGLVRQIEDIKRLGKKQDSVQIEGELHDIYFYDINMPEESALVYLSRKTSLPKIWISVLRTSEERAEGRRMFYRDLEANADIPDHLFEVPRDVRFTGAESRTSSQDKQDPADAKQEVNHSKPSNGSAKSTLVVVTASNAEFREGEKERASMQPGDIAAMTDSSSEACLIENSKHRGWVDRHHVVPMEDTAAYFETKLNANPSDVDALLGRARLLLSLHEGEVANPTGQELTSLALVDLNRLVRLTPTAVALLERGRALEQMGKGEEALKDLDAAAKLEPRNREILRRRFGIRHALKDYARALEDSGTMIRLDPNDAEAHSLRCYALGAQGKFDEAMLTCNTAIEFDKDFATAYLYRGKLWDLQNQVAEAGADYATTIHLGSGDARLARARFLIRQGKQKEAIADLNALILQDPENWGAYFDRAQTWLKLGDFDKAVADATKFIEKMPANADALVLRGLALSRKSQFDQAIKDFTEAIRIDPNAGLLYGSRGQAYSSQNALSKAISDYTKFLASSPDDLEALTNRGLAYLFTRQYAKAIRDFSQAIELSPDNVQLYLFRGSARNGAQDFVGTVDDFTRVIQGMPDLSDAYTYRAAAWLSLEKGDQAIEDLNKALELDPTSDKALVNRGGYWRRQKDFKKAIHDWEQAWGLNPNYDALADEIASFYANCPDTSLRDSKKAIEFASIACEMTHWRNPDYLETLATAYAASGDYQTAMKWLQKSLQPTP